VEDIMSEFDKLKDDAEQYAQQHPEQVKEGEEAAEKPLGMQQDDAGQQDASDQGSNEQDGDGKASQGQ
jgi:hypothetical protein